MAIYQGDKLVAENITIDKSLYTLPVGSIIPYGSNTAPTGFLLCDGSEVSKETYPDLYAVIGDSFGTATDGKFKLPDLRGKFVQGANGDLATVKEAGLPNITGQFYQDTNTRDRVSGAFSYTTGGYQNLANDTPTNSGIVYFDASKSNAIYGNSDTVQPPAVCLSYIIKTLKISDEPNDQYATKDDIAKKVDKVDGMSLIEDTEKERLATVVNYDDTEIKADIAKCATKDVATTTKNGLMSATDKKKLNGLATVATTGSYNDLKDKPSTSDYTVFMQETQPTQEGLWIKGTKKDFMFTSYIPLFVDLLSTTLPSARYDASAVAINGKAYIFGGHDSKSIFEFDPVAKTCTSMSVSLPSARYGTSAVAINDKAYIFGGHYGSIADDILEFDPVAKTCTKMSITLPSARYGTSAVVINDKAYIFGGSDWSYDYKSIFEFDPVAKTCTSMSIALPSTRCATSAVVINGKAYIFGGRNGSTSYATIFEFDPVAKTCTSMSVSLPSVRYDASAVAINDKAYIFGGRNGSIADDILEFDPVAKTCTKMSITLPSARYGTSAVVINGKAYIFGGRNGSTLSDILELHSLDFAGYYIKTCTLPDGQFTKISSYETSSIEKVYDSQTGTAMEAYSVLNGVATKIE